MEIDRIMWEIYIHYSLGIELKSSLLWEETTKNTRLYLYKFIQIL